jgi:hypothetical protein
MNAYNTSWENLRTSPQILRLYSRGEVLEPQDDEFVQLRPQFPHSSDARSIIRVNVQRIADSCGFGVPHYEFVERAAN